MSVLAMFRLRAALVAAVLISLSGLARRAWAHVPRRAGDQAMPLVGLQSFRVDGVVMAGQPLWVADCRLKIKLADDTLLAVADLRSDYPVIVDERSNPFEVTFAASRVTLEAQDDLISAHLLNLLAHKSQRCWRQAQRRHTDPSAPPRSWRAARHRNQAPVAEGEHTASESVLPPPSPASWAAHIRDGLESLAVRLELIRAARHSIWYKTFEFYGDEAGQLLATELIEKKQSDNLDVRIFIDAYPLWIESDNFLVENSERVFRNLMAAGIPVAGFSCQGISQLAAEMFEDVNGINHLNYRYHEKSFLIDPAAFTQSSAALVGGVNTTNQYFRIGTEKWSDVDVLIKGGLVGDIARSFDEDWQKYAAKHPLTPSCLNPHPVGSSEYLTFLHARSKPYLIPVKGKRAVNHMIANAELAAITKGRGRAALDALRLHHVDGAFIKNDPREGQVRKSNKIEQAYLSAIKRAEREIVLANLYFIPSPVFLGELQGALADGIDLKLLTNSMETNSQHGNVRLSRYYYEALYRPIKKAKLLKQLALGTGPKALKRLLQAPVWYRGKVEIYEYVGEPHLQVEVNLSEDAVPAEDEAEPAMAEMSVAGHKRVGSLRDVMRRRVHRTIAGDRTGMALFHAKYAIVDRLHVIEGSFNIDPRSRNLSREHVVSLTSAGLALDLMESFYRAIARSQAVHPALMHRYRKPGVWEGIKLVGNRLLEEQY